MKKINHLLPVLQLVPSRARSQQGAFGCMVQLALLKRLFNIGPKRDHHELKRK
jgi:hypothetical protein